MTYEHVNVQKLGCTYAASAVAATLSGMSPFKSDVGKVRTYSMCVYIFGCV